MNTCDTCKWWTRPAGWETSPLTKFKCQCLSMFEYYSQGFNEACGFDEKANSLADVYTCPQFGCVHWEEKCKS